MKHRCANAERALADDPELPADFCDIWEASEGPPCGKRCFFATPAALTDEQLGELQRDLEALERKDPKVTAAAKAYDEASAAIRGSRK